MNVFVAAITNDCCMCTRGEKNNWRLYAAYCTNYNDSWELVQSHWTCFLLYFLRRFDYFFVVENFITDHCHWNLRFSCLMVCCCCCCCPELAVVSVSCGNVLSSFRASRHNYTECQLCVGVLPCVIDLCSLVELRDVTVDAAAGTQQSKTALVHTAVENCSWT